MTIISCVDDNMGLMFNGRRQSQDKILRQRILEITDGKSLLMNQYSYNQYQHYLAPQIKVYDDFLGKSENGDYCFVEDAALLPYRDRIEKIVLFKWNRSYPADFYFDIPLNDGWKMVKSEDFAGNSHEKITEVVLVPCTN